MPAGDAEVFKNERAAGKLFLSRSRSSPKNPKAAANWVIKQSPQSKLTEANEREKAEQSALGLEPADMNLTSLDELKFKPETIVELVNLVDAKTISSSAAQQVFTEMFETGKAPGAIVQEKGLAQVSDTGAIEAFCDEAIAANPKSVADYKAGKQAALNSAQRPCDEAFQGQGQLPPWWARFWRRS